MSPSIKTLMSQAEEGDPNAQLSLATLYAIGDGIQKDVVSARRWYEKSANQGNPEAAYNFASMLISGEGGQIERDEGLRWMIKASKLGSGDASIWLAEVEFSDDDFKALNFFVAASFQGDVRGLRGIADIFAFNGDAKVKELANEILKHFDR